MIFYSKFLLQNLVKRTTRTRREVTELIQSVDQTNIEDEIAYKILS